MTKLSKSDFMHKYVNDRYEKLRREREKAIGADSHTIENVNKTRRK